MDVTLDVKYEMIPDSSATDTFLVSHSDTDFLNRWFGQWTFPQTHKVGNNGINANFVFKYICSFLHYLDLKVLVNMKLDVSWQKGLPFKVADFIGLLNFEWYSQNEVGNIDVLVLWRDHEKL